MPSTSSTLSNSLAANRLGAPGIGLLIASSVAPLTVVAGVVTTGLAVTGLTAVSAAFITVAASLILFAVGYLAMARHLTNTGAFYAYISKGIGRPVGVGASWSALLFYTAFQVAAYGGLGAIGAPAVKDWTGLDLPWWVYALLCWALTAYLGRRDVKVSEKVLGVLVIAETALVVIYSVFVLWSEDFSFSAAPFSFNQLFQSGGGALLAIAATGLIGIEQGAVYIEESKNPRRTVPRATYATIAIIGVLYAVASWVQISAAGDTVVDQARTNGPDLFFLQAGSVVGGWAVDLGHALFLTSLLAALIAFHNIFARYMYALGREGVLARMFGQTVGGAPRNASIAQSVIGLAVIVFYAVFGLDPLVQLFFWGGSIGGVGVLLLILLTSIAVIAYFARNPHGETAWRRLVAPLLATVMLTMVAYFALTNLSTLFGVEPGTGPAFWTPIVVVALFLAGVVWGLILRQRRPDVYEGIGLGANSAVASPGGFSAMMASTGTGPESTDTTYRSDYR